MSHLRRLCALVAAGTLTTTGLVATLAAPAQAADIDTRPATIGASWLAALGGHGTSVTAIRTAIATAVSAGRYITGEEFGDTGSTYAGAVAKTAVFAKAAGGNPTSFGGVNLITRLEAQVLGTAPNAG